MVTTSQALVYDPFSDAFKDDPFSVYQQLRDDAPLYHNEKWGFWALSRFEDVRAAARDPQTFLSFEGIDIDDTAKDMSSPGFLPDIDNPRHDQLRSVVQRTFLPRPVARLEAQIRQVVERLVDEFADAGTADLATQLAWPLPYEVFFDVLGLPTSGPDRDDLVGWSHGLKDREPDDPSLTPVAWNALASTKGYLAQVLSERRERPREDLLTTLATAEVDGVPFADPEITPESEIVGLTFVLFMAGIESTAGLLSTAFRALADEPEQRARLVADPRAVPGAVEEAVRFDCPLQVVGRTTSTPVTLHGRTMPEGARVFLLYGSANRDERRYEHADRFDAFRGTSRHLGFGEGLHGCLGAPLARLEAKVALEVALPRLGDYRVSGPVKRYRSTPNMRVTASLPVTFPAER